MLGNFLMFFLLLIFFFKFKYDQLGSRSGPRSLIATTKEVKLMITLNAQYDQYLNGPPKLLIKSTYTK